MHRMPACATTTRSRCRCSTAWWPCCRPSRACSARVSPAPASVVPASPCARRGRPVRSRRRCCRRTVPRAAAAASSSPSPRHSVCLVLRMQPEMTMPKTYPLRSLLALAGVSLAVGAAAQTGAAVPAPDRTFVEKAAAGGAAEVEGGKLAEQRATNDKVKQFGAGKGLQLPSSPDAHHHQEMAKLQRLSGAEFDRAYMDHMVKDHKQ